MGFTGINTPSLSNYSSSRLCFHSIFFHVIGLEIKVKRKAKRKVKRKGQKEGLEVDLVLRKEEKKNLTALEEGGAGAHVPGPVGTLVPRT